jgi:hypothetical protein
MSQTLTSDVAESCATLNAKTLSLEVPLMSSSAFFSLIVLEASTSTIRCQDLAQRARVCPCAALFHHFTCPHTYPLNGSFFSCEITARVSGGRKPDILPDVSSDRLQLQCSHEISRPGVLYCVELRALRATDAELMVLVLGRSHGGSQIPRISISVPPRQAKARNGPNTSSPSQRGSSLRSHQGDSNLSRPGCPVKHSSDCVSSESSRRHHLPLPEGQKGSNHRGHLAFLP